MARTLVGLDIGSTGIRAAEFVPGRRRSTLRRHASVPLAQGVVRAGTVVDGEALTEALKELWSTGKLGTKDVRLAIANSWVLVRQMDLDWMPANDFRQALRYQVQDALPIDVDDANLDYHLLEEFEVEVDGEPPRRMARILVVAAAREMVDAFVDAAHRAGLRPVGVDLVSFALLRAHTPPGHERLGEVEAIVDIGSDLVSVVVHEGGVPRFVRMIPGIGGETITQAVQRRYEWTWEDAERTKISLGLPGHAHLDDSQRHVMTPRNDGFEHPAQKVILASAETLAAEIATTLDFYRGSATPGDENEPVPHQRDVTRVLLAGSGALLGGFRELLEERLGTPVEHFGALPQVRTSRRQDRSALSLAVPAGLCSGAAR